MKPEAKQPLRGYEEARHAALARLGPYYLPVLIVVDGADGVGKTSFASWLAWQLGLPTVHLDLYMTDFGEWRTDEIRRIIDVRLDKGRPVIVEGVAALDALDQIGHKPDFLIYVRGKGGGARSLTEKLVAYRSRQKPEQRADSVFDGFVE